MNNNKENSKHYFSGENKNISLIDREVKSLLTNPEPKRKLMKIIKQKIKCLNPKKKSKKKMIKNEKMKKYFLESHEVPSKKNRKEKSQTRDKTQIDLLKRNIWGRKESANKQLKQNSKLLEKSKSKGKLPENTKIKNIMLNKCYLSSKQPQINKEENLIKNPKNQKSKQTLFYPNNSKKMLNCVGQKKGTVNVNQISISKKKGSQKINKHLRVHNYRSYSKQNIVSNNPKTYKNTQNGFDSVKALRLNRKKSMKKVTNKNTKKKEKIRKTRKIKSRKQSQKVKNKSLTRSNIRIDCINHEAVARSNSKIDMKKDLDIASKENHFSTSIYQDNQNTDFNIIPNPINQSIENQNVEEVIQGKERGLKKFLLASGSKSKMRTTSSKKPRSIYRMNGSSGSSLRQRDLKKVNSNLNNQDFPHLSNLNKKSMSSNKLRNKKLNKGKSFKYILKLVKEIRSKSKKFKIAGEIDKLAEELGDLVKEIAGENSDESQIRSLSQNVMNYNINNFQNINNIKNLK